MRCLTYTDLAAGPLAAKVAKVLAAIERGDLRSPDVKKLHVGPYYRAKLDDASRLLLQFVEVQGQTVCLALEVIAHHAYAKSRFDCWRWVGWVRSKCENSGEIWLSTARMACGRLAWRRCRMVRRRNAVVLGLGRKWLGRLRLLSADTGYA